MTEAKARDTRLLGPLELRAHHDFTSPVRRNTSGDPVVEMLDLYG